MIKAIRTAYHGVDFRSRLEAKYAQFFDAHDIKWLYEVEGYDLDGEYYIPDFWLPEIKTFFEVKGPVKVGLEKTQRLAHLLYLQDDREESEWYPEIEVVIGDEEGRLALAAGGDIQMGSCLVCQAHWFFDTNGSFRCRRCGAYDGDHLLNFLGRSVSLPQLQWMPSW
jgi:hypothetical protein